MPRARLLNTLNAYKSVPLPRPRPPVACPDLKLLP